MIKPRLIVLLACMLVLSMGMVACGGSDDELPCFMTATNDMLLGNWLISPNSVDEVASYVTMDGMGGITAHGFMSEPDFGIVTLTGCENFTLTIQNGTANEMVLTGRLDSGTSGTITAYNGSPVTANFTRDQYANLHGYKASGTLIETCSSSVMFPKICDGTQYDYDISSIFNEGPTGTVTNSADAMDTYSIKGYPESIALWADNEIFFFLRTDAPAGELEPYGMIKFSVDDSGYTGMYHLDSDVDGPVGTADLSFY